MNTQVNATRRAFRSPRAAALAGMVFALLFSISMALVRLAMPEDLSADVGGAWVRQNSTTISLALTLTPFAGIAFLWFIGVVRDHVGSLEDQFFTTVFFGSGLLFLAMTFASAAIAGGILTSYAIVVDRLIESGVLAFGRAVTHTIMNVYAIRMAGVFMISLGTIWMRTGVMPRWFVFLTYGLALLMLVSVNLSAWLILVFPAWVFIVSVYILVISLRGKQTEAEEIVGSTDADHQPSKAVEIE